MIEELIVRLVPTTIGDRDPIGRCVIMADILRASTTMISALSNGVRAIYPKAEIEDSFLLSKQLGPDSLLGGERGGKIVDGFDCGNSPNEYTAERVRNRVLILCTTNGTFTLELCRGAERILIGAFVNLEAICNELLQSRSAMIACAGTNRMVTDEDVLFAGAVIDRLKNQNSGLKLDDAGKLAWGRWREVSEQMKSGTPFWHILAESHGGRNLMRLQCEGDIRFCANIDSHSVVPELDPESWIIESQAESATVD